MVMEALSQLASTATKLKIINTDTMFFYNVRVNPTSITTNKKIEVSKKQGMGTTNSESKFISTSPETLKFEILLDSTGATGALNIIPDVSAELILIEKTVYSFLGSKHEPPKVNVVWGTMFFEGRLTEMSYVHSMFSAGGLPIRSKVTLAFQGQKKLPDIKKIMGLESPDISHLVKVKIGDTLPSMCEEIYNDSKYYLQVAKVNNITGFRKLEPGTELLFPPLKK